MNSQNTASFAHQMEAAIETKYVYVTDRYATRTHCAADMIYCKDIALDNPKPVIYCGRQPRHREPGDVARSVGGN
jgi:acid phosphatase class B